MLCCVVLCCVVLCCVVSQLGSCTTDLAGLLRQGRDLSDLLLELPLLKPFSEAGTTAAPAAGQAVGQQQLGTLVLRLINVGREPSNIASSAGGDAAAASQAPGTPAKKVRCCGSFRACNICVRGLVRRLCAVPVRIRRNPIKALAVSTCSSGGWHFVSRLARNAFLMGLSWLVSSCSTPMRMCACVLKCFSNDKGTWVTARVPQRGPLAPLCT